MRNTGNADEEAARGAVARGDVYLGIELGSTRIKTALIGADFATIASGAYQWESELTDGVWTYPLPQIGAGLRASFAAMKEDVWRRFGVKLKRARAIGVSAMMHGYLAFDAEGRLLTPFRSWRNTFAADAARELTALFGFPVSARWSVAHLWRAVSEGETHVRSIAELTTLGGYAHRLLTGERVLGVGDASGMFPVDCTAKSYDARMLDSFDALLRSRGYSLRFERIAPRVLSAGEYAGRLSEAGAALLDADGDFEAGIPFCPPEGDAGSGMTATDSLGVGTCSVSAGTSIFAMTVLDNYPTGVNENIDLVTTPAARPVAMAHCNNGASEIDAWAAVFGDFAKSLGVDAPRDAVYRSLYAAAESGDADEMLAYHFCSGEPICGIADGAPVLIRRPDLRPTLAGLMKAQIYAALSPLKMGFDLWADAGIDFDRLRAHGGLFKTGTAGARALAAAARAPVTLADTAGEGGAWGMAVLAAYSVCKTPGQTAEDFLAARVFGGRAEQTFLPERDEIDAFDRYALRFRAGLKTQSHASAAIRRWVKESGS